MNFTTWFLLGELLIVPLVLLIIVTIIRWRNKKQIIQELDSLLARVNRSEDERQTRLEFLLIESFRLPYDEAENRSLETVQAEKALFKAFAEIQLGTKSEKIGTFDKAVYGLLDQYLELIALAPVTQTPPVEQPPEVEPTWDQAFEEASQGQEESEDAIETAEGRSAEKEHLTTANAEITIEQVDTEDEILEEISAEKPSTTD